MHPERLPQGYNEKYRQSNYFQYRRWLYWPFVAALIKRIGAQPGDTLLDAGCGQGFFSSLFARRGVNVLGVDISAAGIMAARRAYHSSRLTFEVGNVLELSSKSSFDYVFTRSCSLYNCREFETNHAITDRLLSYVRPGGTLIFDYYTRLRGTETSENWIYHSLKSTQKHFSRYPGATVYFSIRLDAVFFGKFALTREMTWFSSHLSRATRLGGELIAVVPKSV